MLHAYANPNPNPNPNPHPHPNQGGPMRFYAGFPTFYARIAPHAMITLVAQSEIKKWWAKE